MTKMEITKRMEELEDKMFILEMKDRWNAKDYENKNKMFGEWLDLKHKLAKMD